MNWQNKQFRFSIRKLKVAVASTVVGVTSAGILGHVILGQGATASPLQPLTVHADETGDLAQKATITYKYVDYENLTAEQKNLLRDSKDFPKEIAQTDTHYLLVYRKDKGLATLPETSDKHGLYTLLSGLGVLAVFVAISKRHKEQVVKVFVVTALSGAALTAANSQALEAGLATFLTENHLVTLGQTLPQPQEKIGDRIFTYYLPEVAPTVPTADKTVTQTSTGQEATTAKPTQEEATSPLDKTALGTAGTKPEIPGETAVTKPEIPGETAVTKPETPAETLPTQPEVPAETLPTQPEAPAETAVTKPETPVETLPTQPEVPAETLPTQPEAPGETAVTKPETPAETVPTQPEVPGETAVAQPETPGETAVAQPETPGETAATKPETPAETAVAQPEVPAETAVTKPETPAETLQTQPEVPVETTVTKPETLGETAGNQPEVPVETAVTKPEESGETAGTKPETPGETAVAQPETPGETVVAQPEVPTETTLVLPETPRITQPIVIRPDEQPAETGEVLDIGTTAQDKPAFPIDSIITEALPFDRVLTADPNLWEGDSLVDQIGQTGSLTYAVVDGQRQIIQTTPALNQLERVGTKPLEGRVVITTKIPFNVSELDYLDTDSLPLGQFEPISSAIAGEKTILTTYKTIRGEKTEEIIGTPVEIISKQAIKAKVKRGTKPVETEQAQPPVVTEDKGQTQPPTRPEDQEQPQPKPDRDDKPTTVDKSELANTLAEAATKKATDYTTDSWKNFERQAIAGQQTFNNPQATQEQVNTATTNLRNAITGLTPKSAEKPEKPATVDKTELEKALIEAATKKAIDYTTDSWKNFERQAIAGQQTFNNPQATQEQVNTATANLKSAITGLTPKPAEKPEKPATVDKTELEKALIEAATKKATDYTTDSWKNFERQAIAGQQTFNNPRATQEQVNTATTNLREAIKGLLLKQADRPILDITSLTTDDQTKTATISYQLTDPKQTFTGATVSIYQGNQKISELRLTKDDLANKQLTFANYDTDYQIRTTFTYTKDGAQETVQLPSRDVRFSTKKLEIKDIDHITLHRYVDGNLTTVEHFQGKSPEAASQYFVRINSSRYRDLLLPVSSFEETTHNGQAAFRVKTAVDQLVEGSVQAGFQDQFDFLIGKDRPLSLSNQHRTNYTSLPGAQISRATAYQNMEKLLPFYNKETLVSYGNLIDPSSKLHNTKLLSVTPMVNNQIIADVSRFKTELNRLMLHYADETIDYLPLAYKSDFRNTAVSEYNIGSTGLIYTPEQFLSNNDRIVEAVLPSLRDVAYKSEAMQSALNIDLKGGTVSDAMDKLYLEPTFNAIKADLPNQLRQLLATDKAIMANNGVAQDYVIDYIKANKERILMGLAYLNRWYNVNFDQTNIKNLASFHQDFFGKPVNTLEFLVNLTEGKEGYDYLKPSRNIETYKEKIAPVTGKAELTDYLTANRKLFTTFEDDNSWFKATSKAYVVEAPSKELPNQDVRVYSLLTTEAERNGILPLLTAKEDELFIMTTMGSITYGMYDRYLNANQPKAQQLDKIKERVNLTAKRQAAHFDAWYRIAPKHSRDKLIKPMPVWDGYYVNNGKDWLPLFGENANQAIKDFFGPVGDRADVANIGAGAWADGQRIAYNYDKVLEDYGTSVFTHEATHNNDGKAYLGGYDRREGMGAEAYALGLLQSGSLLGHAEDALTLNLIFDYKDKEDALDRMTNVSPERFQNADDVKTYMNGVFDVLYTLDYAEAEAVLKQGTGLTKNWFGVLENYDGKDENGRILPHAGNSIRGLTDQEANSLRTWQDLIDKNLIGLRGYATTSKDDPTKINSLERNGYFQSYLFTPHYAALSNDKGAPGDLMFRRMAFELLAEKGYKDGFLPYTSGFLGETAKKEGSLVYSNWFGRDVPLITDKHVFDHVLKDSYSSWADFKKAMFQRRIEKTGQLAPITVNYLGETFEITSFEQIQILMDLAVRHDATEKVHNSPLYSYTFNSYEAYDIAHGSHVNSLKAAIYNAYLRQTKDFRSSIYGSPVTNSPEKPDDQPLEPPVSLNLINNPSLEANDYTSNKPTGLIHRTGNRADYTKVVDGSKVYKTKDRTANDFFFYEVNTIPGKTYTVTADIKIDVADGHQPDGAFFAVKVVDANGNQRTLQGGKGINQLGDSIGKWAKQTLTFTADSTKTHIGLVKWHNNQQDANTLNTTILMDNIKVSENTFYHELWKDTFNGSKLDDDKWSYELGNVRGNEQQHYSSSKENVNVADGILKITATDRPEADHYRHTQRNGNNARLVTYNSGSVQTIGRQEFLYGRIEARMKLPKGQAVFPAFWTLGADFNIANRITHGQGYGWPATGEIDIMEMVGVTNGPGNKTVYGTPHFYYPTTNNDGNIDSGYHGTLTLPNDFADDYHIFGINWSEDRIEWYVDDVIYNTIIYDDSERSQALKAAFNRPQYIQFNLAMGGNWPGDAGTNLAGQSLDIDWVRWLQSDKQKADMARYYADKPKLTGVKPLTIVKGEVPNLLEAITIDREGYRLEVSVDDEFMFVNTGAPDGRNEPKNVVANVSKTADIAKLDAGVYNIFYTTIPTAADFNPRSIPIHKMTRDWSPLVILPTYYGAKEGALLSSITLPDGWRWANPNQAISADKDYDLIFVNTKDPIKPELRREYLVKVNGRALTKKGPN